NVWADSPACVRRWVRTRCSLLPFLIVVGTVGGALRKIRSVAFGVLLHGGQRVIERVDARHRDLGLVGGWQDFRTVVGGWEVQRGSVLRRCGHLLTGSAAGCPRAGRLGAPGARAGLAGA